MSGSFDNPTARVRLAAERFQALRAQPQARTGFVGGTKPDAEPRTRRSMRNAPSAPIVPAGSVTGRSLTLVITIMCFLASLTAGAVYMMSQAANQWLRDIASEVTVQIETKDQRANVDKLVADVAAFLSRQQGVTQARPLSVADSSQLLEPWLGQTDALSALPVPRLIAVELDRINPPANFDVLRAALVNNFPGATLDDHRRWQRQVRTITRSFALGGFAILLLVAAATTAIIVSATKSAMASNRDIVEVLHFVGATDRFIAREFERHFLRLGVRAGIVGAIWAILVFLGMPAAMEFLGGGAVTMAELRRLVGVTSLDLWGYILLGIVVLVIASLCMVTSRIGVFRILNSQH
jgi:cell division transport system permease protein